MTLILPQFPRRERAANAPSAATIKQSLTVAADPLGPRYSTIRGDVVLTWRDGSQWKSRAGAKWERLAGCQAVKETISQ